MSKKFVRLALADKDKEGKSTFKPDFKNNKLHRIMNEVGKRHNAVVDLSGADRSAGSGLSTTRHNKQQAADVDFKRNPTFFKPDGTPKPAGEDLIRSLQKEGIRVFDGKGHVHFDTFKKGQVDQLESVHQEPEGGGKVFKFANSAPKEQTFDPDKVDFQAIKDNVMSFGSKLGKAVKGELNE